MKRLAKASNTAKQRGMPHTAEFDSFAAGYDEMPRGAVKTSGEQPEFFAEYKKPAQQTPFVSTAAREIRSLCVWSGQQLSPEHQRKTNGWATVTGQFTSSQTAH